MKPSSVCRSARGALFALLVVAGCSTAPVESSGVTAGALAAGDWSLLEGGQCLASMQRFYPRRFGARLPTARATTTGGCGPEGACHLWYDDIPDPAVWARVANDGSRTPSLYDLAVFGATESNPYGHVASVDHVESGALYVMDSNYNGDERVSPSPHRVRAPLGWYHLRALGGGGGDPAPVPRAGGAGAETCGDRAARLGWSGAYCEQALSTSAFSRVACNGTGKASSDCTRCCEDDAVGPAHTDESCGVYAARAGFTSARCESKDAASCGGSGPSTGDGCLHCCDTP